MDLCVTWNRKQIPRSLMGHNNGMNQVALNGTGMSSAICSLASPAYRSSVTVRGLGMMTA